MNTFHIPTFEHISPRNRSVFLPNFNAGGYKFTWDIFASGSEHCEAISHQFSEYFFDTGWVLVWKTIYLYLCKKAKVTD